MKTIRLTESQLKGLIREVTKKVLSEATDEKAVSKAQQRFFGMVHAYQKGEMPDASDKIKAVADDMSMKDVEDFAETKHKGLPNHVKKTKTQA